jgi:cytochrome oxidase Cu insertion factor (SCO1/SenC/PrrC family)
MLGGVRILQGLLAVALTGASSFVTPAWSEERVAPSAEEVRPLAVGDRAPAVTLRDLDGRDVALASLWGEKPVVLIFYRGGW